MTPNTGSIRTPATLLGCLGLSLGLACGPTWAQDRYRFHQPTKSPPKPQVTSVETERRDLSGSTTPTRELESRTETEGRKTATHVQEALSAGGVRTGSVETEEETVQIDAQTTRVVRRLFVTDPDRRRRVIEVTEEERRRSPGDRVNVVRSTSKPDLDGRLHVTRREIQETNPLSPGVRQTRTTVLLPGINTTLAPAEQIHETERQKAKGVVEVEKTRLLPDGNGRWETYETRERVVQTETNEVRTEERVQRRDANRQLSLAERTLTREWKDAKGQEHKTVETYSNAIAGTTRTADGRLQLDRRLRVDRSTRPDGSQQSVQELEQRSIVAAGEPIRATERVVEVSRADSRGGRERQVRVEGFDGNGRADTMIILKSRESKK